MQQIEVNKDEKVQTINNHFKLVDAGDVVGKGKGGKNGSGRYSKYSVAIAPHVPWLREQIDSSEDGKIRVRVKDISKAMGPDFVKRNKTSIYWGLKYALFKERISVSTGKTITGDDVLYLQHTTDFDTLPESLHKDFVKELDAQAKLAKKEIPKPETPKVEISKTTTEWVVKHDTNRDNPDSSKAESEVKDADVPKTEPAVTVEDTKPIIKQKVDKGRLITAMRLPKALEEVEIEGEMA